MQEVGIFDVEGEFVQLVVKLFGYFVIIDGCDDCVCGFLLGFGWVWVVFVFEQCFQQCLIVVGVIVEQDVCGGNLFVVLVVNDYVVYVCL